MKNIGSQKRILVWALVLVAGALTSCGGGNSTFANEVSSTSIVSESEIRYSIGDTGPGGGIVVYVDETGFTSEENLMCGWEQVCHYLEMAPRDLDGTYTWYEATKVVLEYSTATANDWLLPSRDALNQICKYAFADTVNVFCNENGLGLFVNSVGGFSQDLYWTVEQESGAFSYVQSFYSGVETNGGNQQVQNVDMKLRVRPARAF
jgi:hypothetical protein